MVIKEIFPEQTGRHRKTWIWAVPVLVFAIFIFGQLSVPWSPGDQGEIHLGRQRLARGMELDFHHLVCIADHGHRIGSGAIGTDLLYPYNRCHD